MVDDTYSQNVKTLEEYHECVSTGKLPVYRGVRLTTDDKLRRALITQLICLFKIDISSLEQTWNIDFADYFAEELRQWGFRGEVGERSKTSPRKQPTTNFRATKTRSRRAKKNRKRAKGT